MSEEDMNAWLIDTDLAHAPSDGSTGVVAGDDRPLCTPEHQSRTSNYPRWLWLVFALIVVLLLTVFSAPAAAKQKPPEVRTSEVCRCEDRTLLDR